MLLCDIPHFGSTIRHNSFLQAQLSNITRIVQRNSASLFDSDLKSLNITRLAIPVVTSNECWNISVFCCPQHTAHCRHITAHCTLQTHYSTLQTADTLQHTAHCRHITAHCTLQTHYSTLHTADTLQHTAHYRHITAHCTLQTHYCTLHTADTLQHTAHCRHIGAHCTLQTHYSTLHTADTLQHTAHCIHITAHCTLQTHYSTLHTADTLQNTAHYRHIAQFVLFSFAVCSNTKSSAVSSDHYVYCSINWTDILHSEIMLLLKDISKGVMTIEFASIQEQRFVPDSLSECNSNGCCSAVKKQRILF